MIDSDRTAVGAVGGATSAETFVEIGIGGGTFIDITLITVIEIHAFEDVADPHVVGTVNSSVALCGGTGLRHSAVGGRCESEAKGEIL